MLPIAGDFRDEVTEFHSFLETLDDADWACETKFKGWTPWDIVAHLHFSDDAALASVAGEDAFAAHREALLGGVRAGKTMYELQRDTFGHLSAKEMLEKWRGAAISLAETLGAFDPKARLPWYGPDMGTSMFTTARYMETWSHAQAIYDMKGAPRTHTDRIRNVAAIGYRTFGWTFVNRKLDPPGPAPYVRLVAPSGEIWEYGDPDEAGPGEKIEGDAIDFCQTVAQVRNVKDTGLDVQGAVANAWMEIAQCFAGPPVDPPAPGARGPH